MESYIFSEGGVLTAGAVNFVIRGSDMVNVPMGLANRDCVQFLADWEAGASVKNADGSAATYSDAAVVALKLTPAGS